MSQGSDAVGLYSGPLSTLGAKAQIAALENGLTVDLVMVPFETSDGCAGGAPRC
jgi:hypothetical protein